MFEGLSYINNRALLAKQFRPGGAIGTALVYG